MSEPGSRRPRLALPFTILTTPNTVRLVAGEDFRYSLTGPALEQWLPGLLKQLDSRRTVDELVGSLDESRRAAARDIIARLYGERVLIDRAAQERHEAAECQLVVEGVGSLAASLTEAQPPIFGRQTLQVCCQDRLDYEAALQFNRRCRGGTAPWLWASTGAMSRGYVSPIFLTDAGPCLECLVRQFRRLSPAPEIYDDLRDHARRDRPIEPVPFPTAGVAILREIIHAKRAWLGLADPPPALYLLHVLESATLEVTTHRVLPDPRCPTCGEAG
jgi:bacteriocin biosynthesis cyclodehydratase domain-containing protein